MATWTQLWPISAVASAAAQWLAGLTAALSVSGVVTGTPKLPVAVSGVGAAQSPTVATMTNALGPAATTSVSGTPAIESDECGMTAGTVLTALLATPSETWKVANTFTNLTQTTYATGATSTGTWATPANATGAPDSANATNTSAATTAGSGTLTLTYAAQVGKTPLTISNVTISLYYSTIVALVGAAPTTTIDYSLNSGSTWTNLSTTTTAQSFGTTPQVFNLTSAVGQNWAGLTGLQVRVAFVGPSPATNSISFDATTLTVTASQVVPN